MTGPINAHETISGSFGTLWHEGEWLSNVTAAQASGQINKQEITRAGTRAIGHKPTTILYSGSMTGYRITHAFVKRVAAAADDKSASFVTELIMKVDDPDSAPAGKTRIRLKGVQFDTINLLNYEAGSIVTDETPFTFSGFEFLD